MTNEDNNYTTLIALFVTLIMVIALLLIDIKFYQNKSFISDLVICILFINLILIPCCITPNEPSEHAVPIFNPDVLISKIIFIGFCVYDVFYI